MIDDGGLVDELEPVARARRLLDQSVCDASDGTTRDEELIWDRRRVGAGRRIVDDNRRGYSHATGKNVGRA